MCIYCGTKKYRKIYENHHGPIPRDNEGRTYEIHHIDGDKQNNHPDNLKCVSIQEHYDIHYSQGDWMACYRMAFRKKLSPEETAELSRKAQKEMVDNGTHPLLGVNDPRIKNKTRHFFGGEIAKQTQRKRVADGTHHLIGGEIQRQAVIDGKNPFLGGTVQREAQQARVAAGVHHFCDPDWQRNNVLTQLKNGTHNFLGPNSPSQVQWTCPHCNKTGKGKGNYTKHHGDKCKMA